MSKAKTPQQIWATIAAIWDSQEGEAKDQYHQYYKPFIYVMEEFMPKDKGMTVLEAGCGTAFLNAYMARQWGTQGVCLDLVPDCLKLAQKRFQAAGVEGDFILGDMTRLPFKDGAFDIVSNQGTIEHFPKPQRQLVLDEMARVSGKYVAILVPNALNPLRAAAKWAMKLQGRWFWGPERLP